MLYDILIFVKKGGDKMNELNKNTEIKKDDLPKYTKPKLTAEGSYSNVFFGIRVGGGCSSCCSRHMPEM